MVNALLRAQSVENYQAGSRLAGGQLLTYRRATVPMHPGDLRSRLTHNLLKQPGLSPEKSRALLT